MLSKHAVIPRRGFPTETGLCLPGTPARFFLSAKACASVSSIDSGQVSISQSVDLPAPDSRHEEHARDRDRIFGLLGEVRQKLQGVIRGKPLVIDAMLVAMLAEGSVLLEDVPGVGKTTLAKAIAALFDLRFQRLQCTPDLLPSDILGGSIYQPASGTFEFRPGPVFCNLFIADEINRASPRTQSALLEAMAENQVTVDGHRHMLPHPFMVIATQNPFGYEGTFPLPESQLDRFLLRLSMDYPDTASEIDLLLAQVSHEPVNDLEPVMSCADLVRLQRWAREVTVDRKVAGYLVEIIGLSRRDSRLRIGSSPRGAKMLLRAAQARAMIQQRWFVLPDDIQAMASSVLAHRVSVRSLSGSESATEIIDDLVKQVEVPV